MPRSKQNGKKYRRLQKKLIFSRHTNRQPAPLTSHDLACDPADTTVDGGPVLSARHQLLSRPDLAGEQPLGPAAAERHVIGRQTEHVTAREVQIEVLPCGGRPAVQESQHGGGDHRTGGGHCGRRTVTVKVPQITDGET